MSSTESWQQRSFESDDDDKDTGSERPFRRLENFHVLNLADKGEGHIPLHAPRPPASVFEGLVAKEAIAESAKDDDDEEEDETVTSTTITPDAVHEDVAVDGTEEFTTPVSEVAYAAAEENAETPVPAATPLQPSAWQPAPFPSIEDFDDFTRQGPEVSTSGPAPFGGEELASSGVSEDERPEPRTAAGGSFIPPAGPPLPPTGEHGGGFMDHEDNSTPAAYAPAPSRPFAAPSTGNRFEAADTAKALNDAEYQGEKRGLRRGLVAGFITGYAVKAYLAHRKLKRFEKETTKIHEQQTKQINQLQTEQQQLRAQATRQAEEYKRQQRFEQMAVSNRPPAVQFEKPVAANLPPLPEAKPVTPVAPAELPPIEPGPAEQTVELDGQQITLQPGQRLERRGWYSVVVDEHGKEVPGIIPRGELFHHEQKEHLRADLADDAATAQGAAAGSAPVGAVPSQQPGQPLLDSGQVDTRHELPYGSPPPADVWHRLPKPKARTSIAATFSSPWLWAAIAVILIVYFAAALT